MKLRNMQMSLADIRTWAFGTVLAGLAGLCGAPASAQDTEAGAKTFKKCLACHAVGEDAKNKVGPHLNKLIGRTAGTIEDFSYSPAMIAAGSAGTVWTAETLDAYLANPREAVPGNKMSFAGLKKDSERANVIAYLATFTGEEKAESDDNGHGTETAAAPAAESDEPPEFTEAYLNDPANFELGKEIWFSQCTHCHGYKAYPGKAPKLKPARYKPEFVFKRVTKGFKKMPAWKDVYTLEERMAIVAYVKSKNFSP